MSETVRRLINWMFRLCPTCNGHGTITGMERLLTDEEYDRVMANRPRHYGPVVQVLGDNGPVPVMRRCYTCRGTGRRVPANPGAEEENPSA